MCSTCDSLALVPKMIQVRNVPDRLHRELKKRAKAEGKPLTLFVQEILERELASPPAHQVFTRIRRRRSVDLGRPAAELLHAEREARGR